MAHFGPTLRRRRRRERPGWRTVAAVLLSLALNALLLTRIDADFLGHGTVKEVRPVEMSALPASAWAANRAIRDGSPPAPRSAPPPPKPSAPAPPPPDTVRAPGQVVDVAPSPSDAAPKDTRFVSDRNNSVEKETRSRFAKAGYEHTLPAPATAAKVAPAPAPGEAGKEARSAPGSEGTKAVEARRLALAAPPPSAPLPLQRAVGGEIPLPPPTSLAAAPPSEATEASPGEGAGEGGARRAGRLDARLAVPAETLARFSGGPAPDRLEGVEEGDTTSLNTREWKYATYFNRIKQAVASAWDPQAALDQRDPQRTSFAYKDRITLVSVVLDPEGGLKGVTVQKTSGVDFIDRTALEAFRKAQPFVNPPRGIVDGNGEIKFTFGFYLEVGHAGFRIYRGEQ